VATGRARIGQEILNMLGKVRLEKVKLTMTVLIFFYFPRDSSIKSKIMTPKSRKR